MTIYSKGCVKTKTSLHFVILNAVKDLEKTNDLHEILRYAKMTLIFDCHFPF